METNDPPKLWGGPECTICRIGDAFRDQCIETGHDRRLDDIDRIAALGITTVRYPILWERAASSIDAEPDFAWADPRLERLRASNIEVIGGLVHHGSGPAGTDLVDPSFADGLARFAAEAARRYPWIKRWTPVNEPLTTARFAALYGHWYPHSTRFADFARALINQCLATARSMRAIREIIPGAKLIQTEDIGKIFSSPRLGYQAEYENQRRWLSLDLLFGRVDRDHPWHKKLILAGIDRRHLEELETGEGRPDLIGVNYYLTSERFLDENCEHYPGLEPGGNGRHDYVDAEAIRIPALADEVGLLPRLREVWERYRSPMAITEVHHGCTRDEQLRWFDQVWKEARQAREEGLPVEAVTLWSLFGAVDWRSLLTRREGHYDPGAFDIRSDPPRPTIIAKAARAYAANQALDHPALDRPGWWKRSSRFYHEAPGEDPSESARNLLILGATGTLGQALARIADHRGLRFHLAGRNELDLGEPRSIERAIAVHRPWAIINAAGYVRVADAERDARACFQANSVGVSRLAGIAADHGIPLVGFSSDLVFDGSHGPYGESSPRAPTSVYGESKARAEEALLGAADCNLAIRTAAFFGPWDPHNFAWNVLEALKHDGAFAADSDTIVSPTYVPDLCHAVLDLLIDGESGIWHLANQGAVSWLDFARAVAASADFDPARIRPTGGDRANTALISERATLLRPLGQAIADFAASWTARQPAEEQDDRATA